MFPSPSLDTLVFDNQPIKASTDLELRANLDLWTNAQFTYESPLLSSPESTASTIISSPPSNVTYESLANYLDFELPQQHLSTQLVQPQQPTRQISNRSYTQLLLPKIAPDATIEDITKVLLSTTDDSHLTPPVQHNTTPIPSSNKEKKLVEEDKRKRNTAASARFRIKKKQREQTMEKTVREMTEKSSGLENRVRELELEIKFLKNLLIEKDKPEA